MNSTPTLATEIFTGGRGGGGSSLVSTLLFTWIERPKPNLKLLGPPGTSSEIVCQLLNEVIAKGLNSKTTPSPSLIPTLSIPPKGLSSVRILSFTDLICHPSLTFGVARLVKNQFCSPLFNLILQNKPPIRNCPTCGLSRDIEV